MPRGAIQEKSLVGDKRALFDPGDCEDIERWFRKTRREREEALMLAVLADAIECFQRYLFPENQREKKLFEEAEEWILEKNNDWLFSFDSICETLQLTPDYLRQGLLHWKEAKSEGIRKQHVDSPTIEVRRYRTTKRLVKRHWLRQRSLSGI